MCVCVCVGGGGGGGGGGGVEGEILCVCVTLCRQFMYNGSMSIDHTCIYILLTQPPVMIGQMMKLCWLYCQSGWKERVRETHEE